MPINFPASPDVNDIYTYAGHSWRWSGLTWLSQGTISTAEPNLQGGQPLQQRNMQAFYEALSNVHNTPVNIVVIGDSVSVQGNATNERPWPMRLSDYFATLISSDPPPGYIPAKAATGPTADVADGSANTSDFSNFACAISGSQVVRHTFYADEWPADRISVFYRKSSGAGDLEIRVNNVLVDTISANNATTTYTHEWVSAELDPDDDNTIEVKGAASGGGTQVVAGFYGYLNNYDKGVRVWPATKSGLTSGGVPVGTSGFVTEMITRQDPDLVIFATGYNDYDDYNDDMRALIEFHEPNINGSMALWVPYILPTQGTRMDEAKNDLGRQIAADYNMGTIDAGRGIPEMSKNLEDLLVDSTHPNAAGSIRVGEHAFISLSGDPLNAIHRLANVGWRRTLGNVSTPTDLTVGGNVNVTGYVSASTLTAGTGSSSVSAGQFLGVPLITFRGTTTITSPSDGVINTAARLQAAESTAATDVTRRSQTNQIRMNALLPSGAIAQNLSRSLHATGNVNPLVSGTLVVVGLDLLAGDLISSISWVTRTTAGSGMTNQWAVLLDSSRIVRGVSADDTTNAWGSNTVKTFAMGTPYTIPTTGTYHVGLMVAGSVVPTLCGITSAASTLISIAPVVCATSSTGQTSPPSLGATMGAYSALGTGTPYVYVS